LTSKTHGLKGPTGPLRVWVEPTKLFTFNDLSYPGAYGALPLVPDQGFAGPTKGRWHCGTHKGRDPPSRPARPLPCNLGAVAWRNLPALWRRERHRSGPARRPVAHQRRHGPVHPVRAGGLWTVDVGRDGSSVGDMFNPGLKARVDSLCAIWPRCCRPRRSGRRRCHDQCRKFPLTGRRD
jgi:hypothetical protein